MLDNRELAQMCIDSNTIDMLRGDNLQWQTNEMCISYFLGCIPYWWDGHYWRCNYCGNYNENDVCHYCGKLPNKT
jgi:hypothetical protein